MQSLTVVLFSIFVSSTGMAQEAPCHHNLLRVASQTDEIGELIQRAVAIDEARARKENLVFDPFYNPDGCFSESRPKADNCTPVQWTEMDMLRRAEYVRITYEDLLAAHGLDYSPRILTCKAVRESCLRPQDESPNENSSASGLTQVTRSTATDLFRRGQWFKPKVMGFEKVTTGEEYHNRMSKSIAAQLELGLAVIHQKSIDYGTNKIRTILKNYYGLNEKANKEYSDAIFDCAACIDANKDKITTTCLKKARSSCFVD